MSDLVGPPSRRGPRRPEQWGDGPFIFEFDDAAMGPATKPDLPPDEGMELSEIVAILRRRALLIVLCILLGATLAWALAQRESTNYTAEAVIRVEDPTAAMSEQVTWNWYGSRGGTDPVLSTMEVLKSRALLGDLVDRMGLRLAPVEGPLSRGDYEVLEIGEFALADTLTVEFTPAGFQATSMRFGEAAEAPWGEPVAFGEVRFTVPEPPAQIGDAAILAVVDRNDAIGWVGSGLAYEVRPETNILDVQFTASDPGLARRVVNEAVEVFSTITLQQARSNNQRRRAFLEDQLAQADSTLRQAQDQLSDFRSEEQVSSSQTRAAAEQSVLMSLEVRREELAADRSTFATLLEGLRSARPGEMGPRLASIAGAPEIAANPVVNSLYQQLISAETARDSLTAGPWGLTTGNPDVARLDQQIATTRGRLDAAIQSHIDAVDARLQSLDELRRRQALELSGLPRTEAEEARLLQEVQSIQRTVEQLRDEYYRAQIAEAVQEGPVEILDLAVDASASEGASLPVMLALGVILGGMTGSGGAFLMEMLNTTVRRREDVERALQVGMVGTIPKLPKQKLKLLGGRRKKGDGPASELVTLHESRSGQAESFRTLRTNLLFQGGNDPIRTIVVTSAAPGEGKTTTASNLAIAYAHQGMRALLVDCDLRKPRVNEVFGLDRKPGITELVLGESSLGQTVRIFQAVENLYVLPAGQLPPNPTELLGGNRMREVLQTLRERFDVVIMDTPPLSGGADGAILGSAADGVILVVKVGETERERVKLAGRQLATVGATLLGAVLNDPDGEGERYGGYAYQYEYYG